MRITWILFALVTFALLLSGCGGTPGAKETQDRGNSGSVTAIASQLTQTPAPAASVLRTERLEIVDKEGRVRALLTTLEDTRPTLALLDKSGEFRAWLFLSEDGSPKLALVNNPLLVLTDAAGEFRLVLRLDREGSPSLGLSDNTGTFRSMLQLTKDGSPVLSLHDKEGKVTWSTPGATAQAP